MADLYAHTPNEAGEWHYLKAHLLKVAERSHEFASKFGAEESAYQVALSHDIGKAVQAFQEYLQLCFNQPDKKHRGPDHKGAGALLVKKKLEPLAFLVAGHHGGLQNSDELKIWLKERSEVWPDASVRQTLAALGLEMLFVEAIKPPEFIKSGREAELFLRMLFSCLVDADFLDTEAHFTPEKTMLRGRSINLADLWRAFEINHKRIADQGTGLLHEARNTIYKECLTAAELEPGFFRLTVPTGGGKTRSGMAFALNHSINHGKDRIIVAIPYTSIIEQTADVYREIFGNDAVLEHHSAIALDEEEKSGAGVSRMRLAAENWDAPIVVTTTVQLFESLFANKTSRCRKLHNIVNSVIILDEVQTLPTKYLESILDVLKELVAHYRVSVVLCTATQPAVEETPHFKGLFGIREIVDDPAKWFAALKRVDFSWDTAAPWTWARVAEEMIEQDQCMTVVNTKKDAFSLLNALDASNVVHLSTNMCGAHRRAVLKDVRGRLASGKPCRLVATQVVEAGVDIDFPVVLRSVGPLDRIVQAAGRCNREGSRETGRMVVFEPADGSIPPGDYTSGAAIAFSLMKQDNFDFHNPAVFGDYFRRLYQVVNLDSKGIQPFRERLQFRDVAERFNIIEDDSVPVVVRYRGPSGADKEVDRLIEALIKGWQASPMVTIRKLQPYMVNLRRRELSKAEKDGLVRELQPGVWEWIGKYDVVRGLVFGNIDPDYLVVG